MDRHLPVPRTDSDTYAAAALDVLTDVRDLLRDVRDRLPSPPDGVGEKGGRVELREPAQVGSSAEPAVPEPAATPTEATAPERAGAGKTEKAGPGAARRTARPATRKPAPKRAKPTTTSKEI